MSTPPVCSKCGAELVILRNARNTPYVACPKCKVAATPAPAKESTGEPIAAKEPGSRKPAKRPASKPKPAKSPEPKAPEESPPKQQLVKRGFFSW